MTRQTANKKRSRQKGGKFIPAFCLALGTIILVLVIISAVPVAVPRLFGYNVYSVVSGSMAPALPVGSILYVEPVPPEEVEVGDIIAFKSSGSVVTHRVLQDMPEGSCFITKGDANEMADINPVPYVELIGRVRMHLPALGFLTAVYSGNGAKIVPVFFAACGLLFRMVGSRMREHDRALEKRKAAVSVTSGKEERE